MGIGYDFGPPREDRRVPRGSERWFSDRALDAEQMRELARVIEDAGGRVELESASRITIEGEHEAFVVEPTGGYLSKPDVGGEDEHERLWDLACTICEWAGWIVVGDDGVAFGARVVCGECGAEGEPCPRGHAVSALRLEVEVSPPEAPAADRATRLDRVHAASTPSELRAALDALGSPPPRDVPTALALLVSDDDALVDGALSVLEQAPAAEVRGRAALADARLRRLEMLADDPAIAARARALRPRLR